MVNSFSLYDYTEEHEIDVIVDHIPNRKLKGLYYQNMIILDDSLETEAQRTSILAEEIGHYETSSGNILDQVDIRNVKQEIRARRWAHNQLVTLNGFIECYEHRCRNTYEAAEHLGVTEKFLEEAIISLYQIHGNFIELKDYFVFFSPPGVMKKVL